VIAVDTNVVIRLLTGDDPDQAMRAKRSFEAETIWLPKTVMLEAEWVLRRLHGLARGRVVEALTALAALPNVRCDDEAAIIEALRCATRGMDFADALHLASARSAKGFATFDTDLVRRARSAPTGIAVLAI
jgi:predicted nucleic acid-binding protein